MIKPNELRIGNLVLKTLDWDIPFNIEWNDKVIKWNESYWYLIGKGTIFLDDFEPISLTEEWLLKFGFKNESENRQYCLGKKDLLINLDNGFYFSEWNGNWIIHKGIEIKYVHQLQNLYFSLMGEELEVRSNYHFQNKP